MFTFNFENCRAVAAHGLFYEGWGLLATRIDREGKTDDSVKAVVRIDDATLPDECPDFNSINYGQFAGKVKSAVVRALAGNPIWFGRDPAGTRTETVVDITANCYRRLYRKYQDSRLVVRIISAWAAEFDAWWWSLPPEEREEKDYILCVDGFCDDKLAGEK